MVWCCQCVGAKHLPRAMKTQGLSCFNMSLPGRLLRPSCSDVEMGAELYTHLRTIHDHSEDNCKIDNPLCESLLQIKETSFPLLSLTQFALLWPRRCRTFRGGNLERWPLDFHEMIKKIKGLGPHMTILDHLLQRRPATSSAESGGVLG